MSISSVGGGLNQYLQALLQQLNSLQSQGTTATSDPTQTQAPGFGDCSTDMGTPSATGTTTAPSQTLSDEILALLTQLQQAAQTGGSTTGASTQIQALATQGASTQIAAASASDPLTQLMSAMDSNGDGSISETEMESFIQAQGGTKDEADSLFTALNQGSTGNLTQATLSQDLQQGQAALANGPQGPHGAHHHHHHVPSADDVANNLVSAMDTNGNGSVDESEFTSFVSQIGGTSADATADFAALDPNNTGSVSAAQFSTAIKAFETANQTASNLADTSNPLLTLLNGFASTSTTSVTA